MDEVVSNMLSGHRLFTGTSPVIPSLWVKNPAASRTPPVYLVLGPNGAGKSVFRRIVCRLAMDEAGVKECIALSMQGRTQTDNPILRVMLYGHEQEDSTGANSASTILKAIQTATERKEPHIVYWDEPDMGMGDEASMGAGLEIADFLRDIPADSMTKAVFITTHNRHFANALRDLADYIHLGVDPADAPPTLDAWVNREIKPIRPAELKAVSRKRWKAIVASHKAAQKEA